MRIELISSAWKADNLPLIYTRILRGDILLQNPMKWVKYREKDRFVTI